MLSADPQKRPQSASEVCAALASILDARPARVAFEAPRRRRGLAMGLVTGMSVLVLGIGGAAVAKTPAGEKAGASIKAAYLHVVKLRADALAHRAPPAPTPREVVAIGKEPEAEAPIVAPAAPPIPAEAAPSVVAAADDDDGEVDAKDAPAAAPAAVAVADNAAAQVDLSEDAEVEVKGVAASSATPIGAAPMTEDSAIAKSDALWDRGAKLRSLELLKRAAKKSPNDAAVFKALAARAEDMREWGEAVKAARRWALLDPTSDARLSLARLERATGHKERALALVEGVIKDDPASPDAKTLLGEMRGQKLALSQ
jgi:tetratricopeptide (TPR) repeat protein